LRGIAQLKFDMKHVFIDNAPGQMRDLDQIAQHFAPEVLLAEAGTIGALFHSEKSGVPIALLGVIPLARSSIDTAPFGLGIAPDSSAIGHVRNRVLNWMVEHVLFRDVQHHWNDAPRDWAAPDFWHEARRHARCGACYAGDNRQCRARAHRASLGRPCA
jgi:hypothetical protein